MQAVRQDNHGQSLSWKFSLDCNESIRIQWCSALSQTAAKHSKAKGCQCDASMNQILDTMIWKELCVKDFTDGKKSDRSWRWGSWCASFERNSGTLVLFAVGASEMVKLFKTPSNCSIYVDGIVACFYIYYYILRIRILIICHIHVCNCTYI